MTIKPVASMLKENPAAPSRAEAEKAVETLLRYIGEDAGREGLRDTPARVIRAFDEFYAGYAQNAEAELGRTFEDISGYDDMVLVRDIDFVSHCEHHMVPVTGRAHVAYWPDAKVVGISKLARVVDIHARRLTSQETMTRQIGEVIARVLRPKGVAVIVEAEHQCMSTRGVGKQGAMTATSFFSGVFREDRDVQARFMGLCGR